MPRIRRWFPVSHDINTDPEVWELTDRFGVTGLRAWLEILSIADRNQGQLPGQWSDYPRLLAGRCQSTTRHLVGVCQFTTRWLLVNSEGIARVAKWSDYHRTAVHNKTPSEPNLPNLPNYKELRVPRVYPDLDPVLQTDLSVIALTVSPKIQKEIVIWVRQSLRFGHPVSLISATLHAFEKSHDVQKPRGWLIKVFEQLEAKQNGLEFQKEHEERKREAGELRNRLFLQSKKGGSC